MAHSGATGSEALNCEASLKPGEAQCRGLNHQLLDFPQLHPSPIVSLLLQAFINALEATLLYFILHRSRWRQMISKRSTCKNHLCGVLTSNALHPGPFHDLAFGFFVSFPVAGGEVEKIHCTLSIESPECAPGNNIRFHTSRRERFIGLWGPIGLIASDESLTAHQPRCATGEDR
ncbi:unnamed protein product [Somion occarium]|uniref:Uncharacterized protein n=1 Tax=Somion occarium TaxID=3059160 RepID=A0ABP1CMY5_9APHY